MGLGLGVIFKKVNGKVYIIMNNYVVEGVFFFKVLLYDGIDVIVKFVGRDFLMDLVVLEISDKYVIKMVSFGSLFVFRMGEFVIVIGDLFGKDFFCIVIQGIVSGLNRIVLIFILVGELSINVIQIDVVINFGNSGGLFLNIDGKIIGINSMKISESDVEGIGFVILSNDVKLIVEVFFIKGYVECFYIGVSMIDLE